MTDSEKGSFKWRLGTAITITVLIGWYSFFQAQDLLFGPVIELQSPAADWVTDEPTVDLTGQAHNVTELKINGRAVVITPEGEFAERLPLSERYNIIKVEGRDRFGNQTELERMVVLKAELPDPYQTDWSRRLETLEADINTENLSPEADETGLDREVGSL